MHVNYYAEVRFPLGYPSLSRNQSPLEAPGQFSIPLVIIHILWATAAPNPGQVCNPQGLPNTGWWSL